jgi:hypothetical protein
MAASMVYKLVVRMAAKTAVLTVCKKVALLAATMADQKVVQLVALKVVK